MKNRLKITTIRKQLFVATSGLIVVLLIMEMLFALYFFNHSKKTSQENVDYILGQITIQLQHTFKQMNNAVDSIALDSKIQDYASTKNVAKRYQKGFEYAVPIVNAAIQNLNYDHVMIFNISNSWHQFTGALSSSACKYLNNQYGETWTEVNTIIELDNVYYLCTVKPIVILHKKEPMHTGMVVAMTEIETLLSLINDFSKTGDISAYLHNQDTIIQLSQNQLNQVSKEDFDKHLIVDYYKSDVVVPDNLNVTVSIPREQIFPQSREFVFAIVFVLFFSLVIILIESWALQKWLISPISSVIDQATSMKKNYLNSHLDETGAPHVDMLVSTINTLLDRLKDYSNRAFRTQRTLYETELEQQKIQMHLLRKQIDAHFFYNSLVSIKVLTERGETDKAVEISQGIASILRYSNSEAEEVNIFSELEIIRRYINIVNIRFENKFAVYFDVDDRLCDYKIIKFLLQPLVENAFKHGLEKQLSPGKIYIRGYLKEGDVFLEVEDNGAGIPLEQLADIQRKLNEVNAKKIQHGLEGIALPNIQKRIILTYGTEYGLSLYSKEGEYTKAVLHLPTVYDSDFSEGNGL